MRRFLYALLIAGIVASCNSKQTDDMKVEEVALASPPPASVLMDEPVGNSDKGDAKALKLIYPPAKATGTETVSKKIIKEGDLSFETGNLKATHQKITNALTKLGGYVEEEKEENNEYSKRKNYVLNVRIPAQNFENFLSNVSNEADRIESKNIRVKDVTTRYIDITTRLKNKQLLENRYKELLQKSGKMSDILEIEDKLNEIRTDIETTQGELNYLNKQIAYSSLNITFFTQYKSENNDGSGFGYRFKVALNQSVELLQSIFFGLITSWPIVLIVVVLFFLFRRWRRKRRAANS